MLSKEKCEVCLNQFIEDTNYYMGDKTFNDHEEEIDILQQLIKKHFELVEKHEMLESTYSMLCEDYLNPQPYKFEDLQTEMQVYDNYLKECIEISVMCGRNRANHTVTFFRWGQEELEVVKFEENRFYPVQMANVRCER